MHRTAENSELQLIALERAGYSVKCLDAEMAELALFEFFDKHLKR